MVCVTVLAKVCLPFLNMTVNMNLMANERNVCDLDVKYKNTLSTGPW